MPGTGYDDGAMRIGSLRSGTRSRRFKLIVLAVFVSAIVIGGAVAMGGDAARGSGVRQTSPHARA